MLELSQCVECVLIISGSFGKIVVPKIHDYLCIKEILIFAYNTDLHKQWSGAYEKVKGVFNTITDVNAALKKIDFTLQTYQIYVDKNAQQQ